jgi:hypothetical protein
MGSPDWPGVTSGTEPPRACSFGAHLPEPATVAGCPRISRATCDQTHCRRFSFGHQRHAGYAAALRTASDAVFRSRRAVRDAVPGPAQRASWDSTAKAYIYRGDTLPEGLAAFRAQPYSWERFREDELNGTVPVGAAPQGTIRLRPHQTLAVQALRQAVQASRPGFLIADDVGLGKTSETWAGILDLDDADAVLIVCPLAVVAHWRRTIRAMGNGGKRIIVMNYERLKKLFEVPAQIASRASRAKKNIRRVGPKKGSQSMVSLANSM